MPFTFNEIFMAALAFYFVVHLLTCTAEIVHLKRTINKVPEALERKISLAQHQKAAHYDIARTKLNLMEVSITSAVIWWLTAGEGIDNLSEALMNQVGDHFAFHWMLPALIGLLFLAVDLPFSWFKEFRLREAYGYTRENRRTWTGRFIITTLLGWLTLLPVLWVGLWFWRQSGSLWWLFGWGLYSLYLIFPLNLARRLYYALRPQTAVRADNGELLTKLQALGKKADISISEISTTLPEHRDDLPPAFAFGHRKHVRIFFRDDVYEKLSDENLTAIGAHAIARNLSHMYFQAWVVSSLVGLGVFIFLAWLAPQSWFLDEIGFQAIGPGPYYGSILAFAIVALPVLWFPFKLPMEAFLRHLIYRSDWFAMRYTSLNCISQALIDLTPSPIRHSSVTLEFFDLLFSHEPSLMARLTHVQKHYKTAQFKQVKNEAAKTESQVRHQVENIERALKTHQAKERLIKAVDLDAQHLQSARETERLLAQQATASAVAASVVNTSVKIHEDDSDNSSHRTYNMGLGAGFLDAVKQTKIRYRAHRQKQAEKAKAALEFATQVTAREESVMNEELLVTETAAHKIMPQEEKPAVELEATGEGKVEPNTTEPTEDTAKTLEETVELVTKTPSEVSSTNSGDKGVEKASPKEDVVVVEAPHVLIAEEKENEKKSKEPTIKDKNASRRQKALGAMKKRLRSLDKAKE